MPDLRRGARAFLVFHFDVEELVKITQVIHVQKLLQVAQ